MFSHFCELDNVSFMFCLGADVILESSRLVLIWHGHRAPCLLLMSCGMVYVQQESTKAHL